MGVEVALNAATGTNLPVARRTTRAIERTRERLSTGLKVNSGGDDATAFIEARTLDNRKRRAVTLVVI